MKRLKCLPLIIWMMVLSPLAAVVIIGCNSTPTTIAAKGEAVLIPSVNVAMTLWADYVNQGKATQQQVDTVKTYYDIYYRLQLKAKAAFEDVLATNSPANQVALAAALTSVRNADTNVVNMITTFKMKGPL
jgi:hypothetical protein